MKYCLLKRKKSTPLAQLLFSIIGTLTLPPNTKWSQTGVTIAGGNGRGDAENKLDWPYALDIDDDNLTIVVAEWGNHRIVEWKVGEKSGKVIAGGSGQGDRLNQLSFPTDVLIDKDTDSLLIADRGNKRVVRWSRHQRNTQGEVIVHDIHCFGLAMDHQRYLYVSDTKKNEIRRYTIGDKVGIIVVGGEKPNNDSNLLNYPTHIFVDEEQAIYFSDNKNNRVMKWNKGAKEGIIVAVGQRRSGLSDLNRPLGLFVDTSGTLYVADTGNNRVVSCSKGAQQCTLIVGRDEKGGGANHLNSPRGLSFDRQGNLYVIDHNNHRVQRFDIK